MASACSSTSISNEERSWVVIGICLTKVLTPALRNVLAAEVSKWHNVLCQPPTEINKQVYGRHKLQLHPSRMDLKYKNINNNNVHKSPRLFDYAVKDPLSLAKLFVPPFMSKFTGFDQTMDISAILSVISEAAPFTAAAAHAKTVRSDIRNEWAHCNFANWTEAKFNAAFICMESLLKNVNLSPEEEQKLCKELNGWKDKGFQLCFGQPVNIEILTFLREKVDELYEFVETSMLQKKEITVLLSHISKIKLSMEKEIKDLRTSVEKCKIQGTKNSLRIERNSKEIQLLEQKFSTELSRCHIAEEKRNTYAFTAPPRNSYFAGRSEEIQELKRILNVEETFDEKKVQVAAVCGMGGIGKTSLVAEYAHQMKDFYKGGVYWLSAEDDTFLDKSINDIAIKVDAFLGSFDLNLSNILRKIRGSDHPILVVLDCLDELNLSPNTIKLLSLVSQENMFGHFVVLTRRNPNRLVNEISIFQEDSCFLLTCFHLNEAKQFLLSRIGVTNHQKDEIVAESLCNELGRLPLALEQAGAYINMLDCSLSSYLEQYKSERLQLLNQKEALPASPGKESLERLAVQTTWLINMEYIKKSPNGRAAVRFMNACSFYNVNEIEECLVNVGLPKIEDAAYCKFASTPLGSRQILKLLTDFSLFTFVETHSVSSHRLVMELVREVLNPWKAESFIDAVRMLSYALSKHPSPSDLNGLDKQSGVEQSSSFFDVPKTPFHLNTWSKLCVHGHRLCRIMFDWLKTQDSASLNQAWFLATAKLVYECAVHLSANGKQEEAKRTLNFAYRILDWLPQDEYETTIANLLSNLLFPLIIPLRKSFQILLARCCISPLASLKPLISAKANDHDLDDLKEKIEKLRLDGNESFKKGLYTEALDAYTSAINMAKDSDHALNPLLLTNRATAYIKLKRYEDALKDANSYITRCPDCWKGYARKALALDGLNENVSAEIAAALAFYYGRTIFSHFKPFEHHFSNLKKRIFICDSADEFYFIASSSTVNEQLDLLKIIVLGKPNYCISRSEYMVLDSCILVGTKSNRSVTLKLGSEAVIRLQKKCMITNLSFYLEKGQLLAIHDSYVKVHNCNFTSGDEIEAAVSHFGEFNAEQCNFINSKAGGMLCVGPGNAVVSDCSFCNNGKAGLEVRKGGTLAVKNSRMSNNGLDGLMIGPKSSKCVTVNCDIQQNDREGIAAWESKDIMLTRNRICDNYGNGIFMTDSEADIRENHFCDNGLWGIWSQSNSWCNISVNTISRNKGGGVRIGYRATGKEFSPSVLECNKIYDNIGPGLVEKVNKFEVGYSQSTNKDLMKSYLNSPKLLQSAKCKENEIHDNMESGDIAKLSFSIPYCSSCRSERELKKCGKCFTSAYCNVSCEKVHLSKHNEICKVLRDKASVLITSMKRSGYDGMVKQHAKSLEGIGPKFSPPPPRDGKTFVVKVQLKFGAYLKQATLLLYDRSLELYEQFQSKVITELVQEFGVQCEQRHMEKKLFLHCVFEDNGHLRLFINEFSDFLNW
ncbi:uncharacterized protein LOC114517236 [Dendronephthya gigantea]|uniref:uncharacterized protein LOC114517236 n=1 Tax=Dendronephthya gigantea TaxID=151771 RepID=UPI00106A9B5E|nr:uncharacterized protein LOC114517236 [Dendronephthya gigantea]